MSRSRIFLFGCVLILVIPIMGFVSQKKAGRVQYNSPEQVIKNHFKALNAKDIKKINKTVTKRLYRVNWVDNLEYIKLIKLREIKNSASVENYMEYVSKADRPYEMKEFSVFYEIKYKDLKKEIDQVEGKTSKKIMLIRKSKNSEWLIYDMGS